MLLLQSIQTLIAFVVVTDLIRRTTAFRNTWMPVETENGDLNSFNEESVSIEREDLNQINNDEEVHKEDLLETTIFNTTVNMIVPMCSLGFPRYSASGEPLDLVYQIALAGFGIVAAVGYIGVPTILEILVKAGEISGISTEKSSSRKRTLRSTTTTTAQHLQVLDHEQFFNKIGLDWELCLRKTICEAHRQPNPYGLLAVPFQMFFPRPSINGALRNSRNPTILTGYQEAAVAGYENNADGYYCSLKYNCFFDVLELGTQLIELYKQSNGVNKLIR